MDYLEYLRQQSQLYPGLLGDIGENSVQPMQQQLANILDRADTSASNMAAQQNQANAQIMQANKAWESQRDAQENATMQQAQQAAEQQRQREQTAAGKLLSLGVSALTGGLGGGAEAAAGGAGEAAAAAEGAKMLEAANAAAGFTPEALGISVAQATPDIMNGIGWGSQFRKWF